MVYSFCTFQINDNGGMDLSPHIKWGNNTWIGVSRETPAIGSEVLDVSGGQSRFFKNKLEFKEPKDGFELSGEAFIRYETDMGLKIRFGLTPPIQDTIDKGVDTQTKWNLQIQMPLKP